MEDTIGGIRENDGRRVPAELHGGALHMGAGKGCEMLSDHGRTGEGDFPDDRMAYEII
ncbi:hypothetical protein BwSF19_77290 [Bradyrhizobium ottawaense]|nr:hypothetical protein BwSF19_77290 [Bradyrhizobium ottawaense]